MCETAYVARYPFTNDQEVNEPDWELFIRETARQIVQQQSVERVMAVRDRLYELLCHCIPADVIFKVLSFISFTCLGLNYSFLNVIVGFAQRAFICL